MGQVSEVSDVDVAEAGRRVVRNPWADSATRRDGMTLWHDDGQCALYHGDVREVLRSLPAGSAQTCVTSPPYYGLRDYGQDGQFGMEATPTEFVGVMVDVFRELRRVLSDDGTLWLNLGDSYARNGGEPGGGNRELLHLEGAQRRMRCIPEGSRLKSKDLVGIPWMVAFALRDDGWYLRSDIIWSKPNPMPESVQDRPTKAHEYLFLLAKQERYYFDALAIREPSVRPLWAKETRTEPGNPDRRDGGGITARPRAAGQTGGAWTPPGQTPHSNARPDKQRGHGRRHDGFNDRWDGMSKAEQQEMGRNKRDVWEIATAPFPEAHFATFPPALVSPCILAGSRSNDVVIDPFCGSGTALMVAKRLGRKSIGIDLNEDYLKMSRRRTEQMGMFLPEIEIGGQR